MYQRTGELWLIAPRDIRQRTHKMVEALTDFASGPDKDASSVADIEVVFRARRELTRAMRADLGAME
jgi:hypothetical protein